MLIATSEDEEQEEIKTFIIIIDLMSIIDNRVLLDLLERLSASDNYGMLYASR